jgi:predicted nuclease of predicted toxin-antitoxin system
MKLLLDENIPKRLTDDLSNFDVKTVTEMGWNGIKNGDLLKKVIAGKFDCLIPADKNMEFQQNFKGYQIPVIVIKVKRITYPNLKPIVPEIIKLLSVGPPLGINYVG